MKACLGKNKHFDSSNNLCISYWEGDGEEKKRGDTEGDRRHKKIERIRNTEEKFV